MFERRDASMFASLASALGLSLVYKWLPGELLYTYNPYVEHNEVSADRVEGASARPQPQPQRHSLAPARARAKVRAARRAASERRRPARPRPPSPSRATRRPT